MKVKFESTFQKDLTKINDKKILQKLKSIILNCKEAEGVNEIENLKKLQGYKTFYRLRIGDYRVGIEINKDTIIFTRFLHRKDIYKFFP